jgi:hypothetical protein
MNRPMVLCPRNVSVAWLAAVAIPAAVAAAALLWTAAMPADPAVAWNVAWTAGALSALTGMLAARSRADGWTRARWTWWVAATACWLAGQIAWDLLLVTGWAESPNVADSRLRGRREPSAWSPSSRRCR